MMTTLSWFPKQCSPGDIDGGGAKRLLGAPSINGAWVLVREMSQNSWDARGESPCIDFILNLRLLRGSVLDTLRNRIFTADPPNTGLAELLRRDEIWALEVSDRGTTGLSGPIRNDLAVKSDTETNFIDLVFNIGAPRNAYLGGGTYGFGKTASYVSSNVGTILIWSRCEGSDGLEHRLIGSAIGEGFDMGGRRFTGRHWWGNAVASEGRVEPVVRDLAQELGESVFATPFDHDVTGTSILILDPQLDGDSPEDNVELLVRAVIENLWPKLMTDQDGRQRMNVIVQLDGMPRPLPSIENHRTLSGHAQCLLAVRAAQAGLDPNVLPLKYPVHVDEIWLKKPKKLLGHLAMTRFPVTERTDQPSHAITYMRHQAELVVRYFERPELHVEGFQWAGVFKPVADADDSFAQAEPPAHDDWVPLALVDKSRRTEVRMALVRIREAAENYLSPRQPSAASSEALPSAAHVGDLLADLLGGLEGSAPSTRVAQTGAADADPWSSDGTNPADRPDATASPVPSVRGPSGDAGPVPSTSECFHTSPAPSMRSRAGRPRVNVVGVSHMPAQSPGWIRTIVDVQLATGSPAASAVDISVRVGVEGGSMDDTEFIQIIGWSNGSGQPVSVGPIELAPDAIRQFVFETRSDLAIDVETKLGDR
jgi:hypothetical protein